jgi:perosamine synthetase
MGASARRPVETAEPSLPYARHSVTPADLRAVESVLFSDWLTQGPEVGRFEGALARHAGAPHAVAVSSGTAALEVALGALGVGPGDEVIVPPITFAATANAVVRCGATPVFADVERDTLNLAPEAVAARLGPRTRGAVAVHFAGHPADVPGLRAALGAGRFVLEDACHALGATLGGRSAGSLGEAACFSFHPAKLVTTGEGGAVTTADAELARRARLLREHGIERARERFTGLGLPGSLAAEESGDWVYEMQALSANHRLCELGAALGRSQLRRLPELLARRRELARGYAEALADCTLVELPAERPAVRSAWHLFPIRLRVEALAGGRARVFADLRARGIGVQVHYVPVHLHPWYRARFGTGLGDHPVSEAAYLRLLSLPLFPAMTDRDSSRVVETLREVLAACRR